MRQQVRIVAGGALAQAVAGDGLTTQGVGPDRLKGYHSENQKRSTEALTIMTSAEPTGGVVPQFEGIDYIEFYVGNAKQAMHFYRTTFGLQTAAYSGLETGNRDCVTFVAAQNDVRLLITEATSSEGHISEHVKQHGDGIRDVAFAVDDAQLAFELAVAGGATPVLEPTVLEDDHGRVVKATVAAFGDTVHSFIQRQAYTGVFLPGFEPVKTERRAGKSQIGRIDHIAISVEAGTLDRWADYYGSVLGFVQSREEDIMTEYSGMNSKVMQNSSGSAIVVLIAPMEGQRKSPIEEYLTFYEGPGVQHVAVTSEDIVRTVRSLRHSGVEFTTTPASYYEVLEQRVGKISEDLDELRAENILVDRERDGYLLQIFSKPVQSRPTFFFEVIQRKGAEGFGSGNIKALFDAQARDQELRGNA